MRRVPALVLGATLALVGCDDTTSSVETGISVPAAGLTFTGVLASALLGRDAVAIGDAAGAIPYLEDALAGGLDVADQLPPAYFAAGHLADYLRVASAAGWPLGDDGALAGLGPRHDDVRRPCHVARQAAGVRPGSARLRSGWRGNVEATLPHWDRCHQADPLYPANVAAVRLPPLP